MPLLLRLRKIFGTHGEIATIRHMALTRKGSLCIIVRFVIGWSRCTSPIWTLIDARRTKSMRIKVRFTLTFVLPVQEPERQKNLPLISLRMDP